MDNPAPIDANPVAQSFLGCLARAKHVTKPFDYWLLVDALPWQDVDGILSLPFAPPQDIAFTGKREANNSTRVYFTKENQAKFDVCHHIHGAWKR